MQIDLTIENTEIGSEEAQLVELSQEALAWVGGGASYDLSF